MKIIRETNYCPVDGSPITSIYKKTIFGKRLIISYTLERTIARTLGVRESNLPSVQKEYGDIIGYTYIFKQIYPK
jgi:hypothetical protein